MNAKALPALLLSLLAVSAFADEATLTRIATPEGAPRTVADAVQRLRDRIWTPQPGSTGTVSQSFPAVSLFDSVDNFTAFALGLRQDASYRTNVGVVNLDSVVHTWTITSLNTSATMTLQVQPFSLSQTGVPASFAGSSGNLSLTYDVHAADDSFTWSAYASSVDNVTGDGWVSRATQ